MLAGLIPQLADDLAVERLGTGDGHPLAPQVGEILGERDEARALVGGARHQLSSRGQVGAQIVGRRHLHDAHTHGRSIPSAGVDYSRNAEGSTPVRRITS